MFVSEHLDHFDSIYSSVSNPYTFTYLTPRVLHKQYKSVLHDLFEMSLLCCVLTQQWRELARWNDETRLRRFVESNPQPESLKAGISS